MSNPRLPFFWLLFVSYAFAIYHWDCSLIIFVQPKKMEIKITDMTNRNECLQMSICQGECIQCPFARRFEHTNTPKPHRRFDSSLSPSKQIWRSLFFNGATSSRLKHAHKKREQAKKKKKKRVHFVLRTIITNYDSFFEFQRISTNLMLVFSFLWDWVWIDWSRKL